MFRDDAVKWNWRVALTPKVTPLYEATHKKWSPVVDNARGLCLGRAPSADSAATP